MYEILTSKMKLRLSYALLYFALSLSAEPLTVLAFMQASPSSSSFIRSSSLMSQDPALHKTTGRRSSSQQTTRMYLEGGSASLKTSVAAKDTTSLGNLQVPSVGIGTISWSSDSLTGFESEELQSLVNAATSSNAAFFDTAERYGSHLKTAFGLGWGETENLLRVLLDRAPGTTEPPPVIATKFTPSPWRQTAQSVVDACEQSRTRLGVDQIDLYQLHMPDIVQPFRFLGNDKPKDEIYWNGLAEAYHQGLVKNVGVSNYGPTLLMRCQEALAKRGVPLASNQIAYSLIGRHNGSQETLDKCNELGIRTLACYPFAMGLLTGKYSVPRDNNNDLSRKALQSLTTNRKTGLENLDLMRYSTGDGVSIPVGGVSPLLDVMEGIALKRGKTIAQVALNYIVCKGAIPIPGANTDFQVLDNIGSMGWRLSDEEVERLEETSSSLGFDGFDGAGFKRTSEKFVGYGIEKWSLLD